MTETRSVSSGSAGRAALEDEQRRAAEASAKAPSTADAARTTVRSHRGLTYIPPYGADLQAFIANASKETRVPPAFGDLTLYTDDALEHEIDSTRSRLAKRTGPEGEVDRLVLDRLEGEVVRRHAPPLVDASTLKTRGEVEKALEAEVDFFGTYGSRIQPTSLRGQHQQALGDLERRHQAMVAEATACDNAKPVVVPTLGDGVSRKQITADMIVATLKQRITLTPQDEASVRASFERWRSDVCRTTGQDPTTTVASNGYREAHVDTEARDREMLQMRLDMLNASATSACAALAFLDSTARGDSLVGAHRRVMLASTLSDVALTMPSRHAQPKVESQAAKSTEVEGLKQRIANEAQGVGHAQTTRFRGVDNSQFAKGGTVTYGPYRKNVGPPRSVEEVIAIYEKATGRKIPSYVKVVVDASNPPDEGGKYVFKRNGKAEAPFELEQLTDGVVVRIRPEVLESDEAIVGTLRHEAHELENLERLLRENDLTNSDVTSHIKARGGDNLHGQAWDVADLEVLIMRERPGSPRHAELLARQKSMLARMDVQNHGSSQ